MHVSSTVTDFLGELFAEYDRQGIKYCLLRNFETLPERLESRDVDVLLARSDRERNRAIIRGLVESHTASVYHHYVDERFDQFFIYRRDAATAFFELKLDFFHNSELYGVRLVSGEEILCSRIPHGKFYVASEVFRAIDKWLFIYLLGIDLPRKYHEGFREIVIRNRVDFTAILVRLLGRNAGESLCERICADGFENLPRIGKGRRLLILFNTAIKAPWFHLKHLPLFIFCRFKHSFSPKGEFISLSGPDGSGKTTVLELAREQLGQLFGLPPENQGHFRPGVLPRIAMVAKRAGVISVVDENYDEPHRSKPSGFLGSLLRFLYYVADYLWGYFTKIRPALVRRELVIYDRYYFDMVADPGRSRIALPLSIRKLGLWLVPLPDTAFFIHASPEVIRQRKQELTTEKIEELNATYLDIARSSRLQVLDNDQKADVAAARLVDTVIARRRKRFGLDKLYP